MGKNSQLLFDDMTFKELMGHSLKHWRKAVAVGVLLALLLSGFMFASSYKTLPSQMSEDARRETEKQIEDLEKDIELLNNQISVQQDYIDNSILMNINPNTMVSASIVYYIQVDSADSQLEKKVNYAYYTMICSGEIAECISKMDGFSASDYLQEIITADINVDSEVPCVAIYVKHYDFDMANQLLDAIADVFEVKKAELVETMGEFELKEISRSVSSGTFSTLIDTQADAYTSLSTLQSTLSEKESELEGLTGAASVSSLAVKTAIFFLVGFAVGVIIVIAIYAVLILASSKIKSANQLRSNYSVRVLGSFVFFNKDIKFLDRLAYKLSDENIDMSNEQVAEIVNYNIGLSADGRKVLIVNLSDSKEFSTVKELMKNVGTHASVMETGFENPETLKEMQKADAVAVAVEKFGNTLYQLDAATKEIEAGKKDFLGVILI